MKKSTKPCLTVGSVIADNAASIVCLCCSAAAFILVSSCDCL